MSAEFEAEVRKAAARARRYLSSKPSYRDIPLPEGLEMKGVLFGGAPTDSRHRSVTSKERVREDEDMQ